MTAKSFLFTGALVLSSMTALYARSYHIGIADPVQVGGVQLQPGAYTVKLQGSNAVFTSAGSARSFTAPVRVENGGYKFSVTAVGTSRQGDMEEIRSIELGGSTNTLEFGE